MEQWLSFNGDGGWVQYFGGIITIQWVGRLLFRGVVGVIILAPQYRRAANLGKSGEI